MTPERWQQVRAEFPALENWTFLNTATFGQLPRRAVEAANRHFAHRDELACHDFLNWFDDADRLRAKLAQLIRAEACDIAFAPSASTGLGWLAASIDWQPGDRVVTLTDEFPNQIYFAGLLGERGIEFVEAPWERFYDEVTPDTRLVAISTVSYMTGFRPPVEEIGAFLRERGILFYLDGTQSVGGLEFDTRTVAPDVFVVHGYKWLLSPTGAAFVYVAPGMRERMAPQAVGWRSHYAWRRVESLHHGPPEFPRCAERYEGGMLAFPLLYAMEASVSMMLELGTAAIEQRVLELAGATRAMLRGLGAEVTGDGAPYYRSPIVAARFAGRDASALAAELAKRRVLVSARHGHLRVSPHFYNDESDLERLEGELKTLL